MKRSVRRQHGRTWTISACVAFASLLGSKVAHAEPPADSSPSPEGEVSGEQRAAADDERRLSALAVSRFEAKDYDGAAEAFSQAYEISNKPNYLFNIGRVYEEKGDLARAAAYYEQFIASPNVAIEAREAGIKRLSVLQQALSALGESTPVTEPPAPDSRPAPASPSTRPSRPTPATSSNPETDAHPPSTSPGVMRLRIGGYATLGVGAAALIGGAVAAGLTLAKTNEAEDADFVDETETLRREAQLRANVADGLFIAGGVVAAVGVVLVGLSYRGHKSRRADQRAFIPWIDGTGARVAVLYRF